MTNQGIRTLMTMAMVEWLKTSMLKGCVYVTPMELVDVTFS